MSAIMTELRHAVRGLITPPLGDVLAIHPFPKSIDQLPAPQGKGLLLYRLDSIRSEPPESPQFGRVLQVRRAFIEFLIFVQMLRASDEADPILDALDDALTGVVPVIKAEGYSAQPPGFFHVESGLVSDDKAGIWDFGAIYAIDLIYRKRRP